MRVSIFFPFQWFGNLVTIQWWTHLWLKEGYATWIEFLCVDHLFPEWDIWTQFLTDTCNPARSLDALQNSHPIEVEVTDPAQIDEIFDMISYNKGSSIIRMLFNWIGEENFRKGMNAYLVKHAYGCAATEYLWEALSAASGKNVDAVMSTWTKQKGYPLITLDNVDKRDANVVELTLRQHCYLANGKGKKETSLWSVPIAITTKDSPVEPVFSGIMDEAEMKIEISGVKNDENVWFNLNPKGIGFYRVSYPPEMISNFSSAIREKCLSVADRLTLLNDQLALCQTGQFPIDELFRLMENFREEENATVWECLEVCLSKIRGIIQGNKVTLEMYHGWVRWLMQPSLEKVGWNKKDGESHLDSMWRALIIRNLVKCEHDDVLDEGVAKFGTEGVAADLLTSVYKSYLKKEGMKGLEKLKELTRESTSEAKIRIYDAMGACGNPDVLQSVLDFALSDEVRFQDTRNVLTSVANAGITGRDLAWSFFKGNANTFKTRYKQGGLLTNIVKAVTLTFDSEDHASDIESFFENNAFPGADRTVKQSLEAVRLRAQWMEREGSTLEKFLKDAQY